MDRQAAAQILPMLMQTAQQIADTIDMLEGHTSDERLQRYSDAVGNVIFAIDGLVQPILNEHPHLRPR